jgi:uncharacterized protein YabN with tetrapyrrole methylase and pyrophosphatase domain
VTDGIPTSLPALLLSTKLQRKGISVGLGPADAGDELNDTLGEIGGLARALTSTGWAGSDAPSAVDPAATERLLGELLFALANLARQRGIDPEQALRARALALRDSIVVFEGDPATPGST